MARKKNEDPPIKTDGWMNTFSDLYESASLLFRYAFLNVNY